MGGGIVIEWIIVDDGSTDGTEILGEKWCKENKLAIKYYKQENQGKHVAMNLQRKLQEVSFGLPSIVTTPYYPML